MFFHACQGKDDIAAGRIAIRALQPAVAEAHSALRRQWSGRIYDWGSMTEQARAHAERLVGSYRYARASGTSRQLDLLPNGEIGVGRARCEQRWSVVEDSGAPSVALVGAGHKDSEIVIAFIREYRPGVLMGRWTMHERDLCSLTREA